MKTYSEKLKDPRWQRKRLEILTRDDFACQDCRSKSETLHVHHSHYRKGAAPWDYENGHLITLCEGCHDRAELRREMILKATVNPHVQKDVYCCASILSDFLPVCGFHQWILTAAIKLANAEMDARMATCESEMLDSIHEMKGQAAEIVASVHRVLFHLEGEKEKIKKSYE